MLPKPIIFITDSTKNVEATGICEVGTTLALLSL